MTKQIIAGLVLTAAGEVYQQIFTEPLYESLREAVGGGIEIVHPIGLKAPQVMIVDDEGLLKQKPVNVVASALYGISIHGQPIVGDVVILAEGIKNGEPDLVSLNGEQLFELRAFFTALRHQVTGVAG